MKTHVLVLALVLACLASVSPVLAQQTGSELHDAVQNNKDLKRIQALLDAGAKVDLRVGGLTPLHCVTRSSVGPIDAQIAQLLIAHGADVNAIADGVRGSTFGGLSPAAMAIVRGGPGAAEVLRVLIAGGAKINGSLQGDGSKFDSTLLSQRPSLLHLTSTSLVAGVVPRTDLMEILIKAGAEVNALDASRRTPLHWAALVTMGERGLAGIKCLLQHGADPTARDGEGLMPLHLLVEAQSGVEFSEGDRNDDAVVRAAEILIDAGADPKAASHAGLHAVDLMKWDWALAPDSGDGRTILPGWQPVPPAISVVLVARGSPLPGFDRLLESLAPKPRSGFAVHDSVPITRNNPLELKGFQLAMQVLKREADEYAARQVKIFRSPPSQPAKIMTPTPAAAGADERRWYWRHWAEEYGKLGQKVIASKYRAVAGDTDAPASAPNRSESSGS